MLLQCYKTAALLRTDIEKKKEHTWKERKLNSALSFATTIVTLMTESAVALGNITDREGGGGGAKLMTESAVALGSITEREGGRPS